MKRHGDHGKSREAPEPTVLSVGKKIIRGTPLSPSENLLAAQNVGLAMLSVEFVRAAGRLWRCRRRHDRGGGQF